MGYASDTGYVPLSIPEIMEVIRVNVNAQFGTSYIQQNFIGTNFYKFMYALAQRIQENEVKTSEIFLKMQEYFSVTNEKILRPNTTHPGIFDYFRDAGFLVSTKPPSDTDRGKLFICVDVDDSAPSYATTKLALCNLVKNCCVGGVVSQGDQVEAITLSNGQSFDFKYSLPTRIPVALRLTITTSENNLFTIDDPLVTKQKLLDNIEASYRLGKNFEPQRYFSVVDAQWAATVLLEWTDDVTDGEIDDTPTWSSSVYDSAFDELFEIDPALVEIVEV